MHCVPASHVTGLVSSTSNPPQLQTVGVMLSSIASLKATGKLENHLQTSDVRVYLDGPYPSNISNTKFNTGNKHKHLHHVLEDQLLNITSPTFVKDGMCRVNCTISIATKKLSC